MRKISFLLMLILVLAMPQTSMAVGAAVEAEAAVAAVAADAVIAVPNISLLQVDGRNVTFDAYNIEDFNYLMLRDLAYILNGTSKQFSVDWDDAANSITLTSGQVYIPFGGEMTGINVGKKTALPTYSRVYLDGVEVHFDAYNIDGFNYIKLRDLGTALDFGVEWDGGRLTVIIDTSKHYSENNSDDGDDSATGQELSAQQLPTPVGDKLYNNGSSVVQYGDCFYFYAQEYDAQEERYQYGVYVRRENESQRYRLQKTVANGEIYVVGDYILTSNYSTDYWTSYTVDTITYRINMSTGYIDAKFLDGKIRYIDYEAGEIYYDKGYPNNYDGLYRIDVGGRKEKRICNNDYDFLYKDGDTIYLQDITHDERGSCNAIIYKVNSNGAGLAMLASIPLVFEDEDTYRENEYVTKIDIIGDWVYMSVGFYQGSINYFFGGLVRMKKDGSGVERFLTTEADTFSIMDGWLYFNDVSDEPETDKMYGGMRMRLDLSGKKFLGTIAKYILHCSSGRIVYEDIVDYDEDYRLYELRCCAPAYIIADPGSGVASNDILLLNTGILPIFDDYYYADFCDVNIDGDYVFFTVYVCGLNEIMDGWRGHDDYMALYRVRKDGSGLTLINEDYLCPWD